MNTRTGVAACGALLLFFASVSLWAVRQKSATFDEPVQALAGWLRLHYGDFRFNFEDPPLWEDWAALPNGPEVLRPDFTAPEWVQMPDQQPFEWSFAARTLYHTPGVDGEAFVQRSRAMMLVIGVAFGAMIAFWAWRLGGPLAAIASAALFALDPNFLGHAALVKNDVSVSFLMLAMAFTIWRIGERLTLRNAMAFAAICGVASIVKFSTVLFAPIALGLLALRVWADTPWPVLDQTLSSRMERAKAAGVLVACAGCVVYVCIWAAYGFRFSGTPDPSVHINSDRVFAMLHRYQAAANAGGMEHLTAARFAAWRPDLVTRLLRFALEHRLLPEAWVDGFLFIYASSLLRSSFLFNGTSEVGWWYYFPIAMLIKTPIATLIAIGTSAVLGIRFLREKARPFEGWWAVACLAIPPGIYFASAMTSHMNIGIRHIFPVYGFIFTACGVVFAEAFRRWGRTALAVAAGLAVVLAVETGVAAPNFIAFFNVASGGPRSGIDLLGDSNLDWGQDLPLLAEWRKKHPEVHHVYLSYFGMVDPGAYGIHYRALPGNYQFGPQPEQTPPRLPAVFAISANHLQGFSVGYDVGEMYAGFRKMKPREVLGGTIYLYDVPDEQTLQLMAPHR
jgi:hypothetical protein